MRINRPKRTTPLTAPFQDFITRVAWGDVWARPGLDRRTRSCITLAIVTALRSDGEIALHVRGALRNGLTPDEKWHARFNPQLAATPGAAPASGWSAVIGVALALMLGATVLMSTIAFSGQRYFEYQIEEARKISQ